MSLTAADDAVNGTYLASELRGYRRGYGILPGALAAVNDAGFSQVSTAWAAATMGRPNVPRHALLEMAPSVGGSLGGRTLVASWSAPDWNGGYPLSHYELTLQRYDAARPSPPPRAPSACLTPPLYSGTTLPAPLHHPVPLLLASPHLNHIHAHAADTTTTAPARTKLCPSQPTELPMLEWL